MVPALVIGMLCVFLYGLFLFIRGLFRLAKMQELKMLYWILGAFGFGAILVGAGFLIKVSSVNIWIALPLVVIAFILISAGYFLESFLRAEQRRRVDGLAKVIPVRPKNWLRNNLFLLVLGMILWAIGAFVGYGESETVNTCLLCLCMFLFARSIVSFWKYRGF